MNVGGRGRAYVSGVGWIGGNRRVWVDGGEGGWLKGGSKDGRGVEGRAVVSSARPSGEIGPSTGSSTGLPSVYSAATASDAPLDLVLQTNIQCFYRFRTFEH